MRRVLTFVVLLSIFLSANSEIDKLVINAKKGDSNAIYQLGYCYEYGLNVKQDSNKAKELYISAAKLGNEDAKISLDLLGLDETLDNEKVTHKNNSIDVTLKSDFTINVSKDELKNLVKRAKSGDKSAMFTIGTLYDNGYGGMKKNRNKAIVFYKKAASLGSKKAKDILLLINKK